MSVPVDHLGATNFVLVADNPLQSSTCLEPVAVNDKTEMDVGTVAYDLCNDTGIVNQFNTNANLCSSNPQLTSFLSLSAIKSPTSQMSTHCRNTSLSDQYTYNVYSNYFTNNSWLSQHSDGYLTPISSMSDCPNSVKSLPTDIDHSKAISSSGGFVNKVNHFSHVTFINGVYQPSGVVCSTGDMTPSHNNSHNHNINGNTHVSNSNTVSNVQTNSINLTENEGSVVKQEITSNNYDNVLKETINTNHVTSSSAVSIDDSLYQLSEEEIKEIDTSAKLRELFIYTEYDEDNHIY
ncbi:hypothetical protein EWB00_002427 [Schistosoma japonicum]|uniref:Uncharacterized protein n=1 Tax=Schistosoma japonicum TaxID=6182 RepID=A0A4Z2DCG8_SCHJA|nr:hypothetical protein EWB00_002427 [Schistosoma japonicum]